MAELTLNGFLGVVTQANQLNPPRGSLAAATNCAIERDGVIQPRRGTSTTTTFTGNRSFNRGWEFQSQLMVHVDDGGPGHIGYISGGAYTGLSGTWSDPGADYRLHQVEVAGALFVATDLGIKRLEAYNSSSGYAGVPKCPDLDRANSSLAAGSVIPASGQRAYRAYLEVRPLDGSAHRTGAPSGRLVMQNSTASAQNATVRVLLPTAVNTAATTLTAGETWLVLVASSTSASLTVDPSEDYAVIYDYLLTATDITNGYVDIEDVTPDALRGSALYTNPTQETILGANEPPPFAYCIGRYRGCLVAANLISKQRLEINVLAVDGTNGIQNTDVLNFECGVASFTITGKTTPAASTDYQLETGGTASANIMLTAQNIVSCINRHTSNTFCYARYAGIPDDPRTLGLIAIESRIVNTDPIYVYVDTGDKTACFEPQLPDSPGDVVSSADVLTSGWALSKPYQPDAFPLTQYGQMGAGNITCIASLEDACFFFHDSGEVWVMSGETPIGTDPGTLRIERRWTNLNLLCPFTVQELDGRLIALTDRGVVAMSPGAIEVLSKDIDDSLRSSIYAAGVSNVRRGAWAVVQPSERRYVLSIYDGKGFKQYVLNGRTGAWTIASGGRFDAIAGGFYSLARDTLYYGDTHTDSTAAKLYAEANGTSQTSYNDSGTAISCTITTPPLVVGDGTTPKQVREVQLAFESSQPSSVTVSVATEFGSDSVTVATQSTNLLRVTVPQSVQRGVRHTITLAVSSTSKWALSSIKVLHRAYGNRGNK